MSPQRSQVAADRLERLLLGCATPVSVKRSIAAEEGLMTGTQLDLHGGEVAPPEPELRCDQGSDWEEMVERQMQTYLVSFHDS